MSNYIHVCICVHFIIAQFLLGILCVLLMMAMWCSATSISEILLNRWKMKEKGTVYDGMVCIELMEIDARDRTYDVSVVVEFIAVRERERGRDGKRLIKLYCKWNEEFNN